MNAGKNLVNSYGEYDMNLKFSALAALTVLSFGNTALAQKVPYVPGDPVVAVPAGGSCAAPSGTISATGAISGNNAGGTNSINAVPSGTCSEYTGDNAKGPEDIYVITPGSPNSLTFTLTASGGWDPMMYILSTCGSAASCMVGSDDISGSNLNPSPLLPTMTPGTTYYVYVDSWYANGAATANNGPYNLNVTGTFPVTLTEFAID